MGVKPIRRPRPATPVEVSALWRAWVHRCVRLGAWAACMASASLVILVLLIIGVVHWPSGRTDVSPMVILVASLDLVALVLLARGWIWPRWPDQPPNGSLAAALDPLGNTLPVFSLLVLSLNVLWGILGGTGLMQILQLASAMFGLILLAGALYKRPSVPAGPTTGASG
ncbi:MAG: hypothetical protein ACOYEV_14445 [Candidatus Nanopelagicales bacterium]